ncbi:MAG: CBS domain-containing protein [Rhodospirillales bacterium]|nr:CBS domain-containing protein [Alphaproteobacteria bacterium]MBL6947211.1 CBS domain-containing protein [Rhodospirillales bacterium]
MESRIAIFSKLVRDCMRTLPLALEEGTSLGDVVRQMEAAGASSATVIDAEGRPIGIITERDITRRAAFKLHSGDPVEEVMTAPVLTIQEDEYLYYAIARMRRQGLRHMPVIDGERWLVGMLNLHDALATASETLMGQIDILTRDESLDGLKTIKAAQVELADQLLAENMPATEIQALLTHINNDIYRRVVNLSLSDMEFDGMGKPPVDFCVIVMGSGGRGENFLYPDQDNGLILEDYPDDRHTEIDAWFIELGERMCRGLDQVGLPLCKGFVMATNPLWRKTLSQWKEQVALWSHRRGVTALRLCDIFFDFRTAWGEPDMADELRHFVTETASGNPAFLRDMYEDDVEHMVALGWFGRLLTEKEDEDFKGRINLKHTGTLPLVEAMRLLAFRDGIKAISTLERMDALKDKGVLNADEHDYLSGAFRHISHLLLRQQVADFKAGEKVSNFVHPDTLSERERDMLVDSFKAIRALRAKVKSEFTGDVF